MIGIAQEDGLWTLTIDRQEKANSLTRMMLEALDAAVAQAADASARALILTATGRVFSAGADLDEARAGLAVDAVWERLSGRIAALPFLTIAALNGTLAGGAMGIVLACDLRIAVPSAKIFYPVMKLGFLPQPSDAARLTVLVGPARAKMILMAGVRIDATEARDWGLIDRVVDPSALLTEAGLLAGDVLAASLAHVAAVKRLVR